MNREDILKMAHKYECLDEQHYGSVWAERLERFALAMYNAGVTTRMKDDQMKLSRIDQIALNGATGEHYKYEEVADKLLVDLDVWFGFHDFWEGLTPALKQEVKQDITKILVESFPNEL